MKQKIQFTKVSPISKIAHTMEIELDFADYRKWSENKMVIQLALPYLTAAEREFLMTGIIDEEWQKLFAEENQTGRGKEIDEDTLNIIFTEKLDEIEEHIKEAGGMMMAMVDSDVKRLPETHIRMMHMINHLIEIANAYNRLKGESDDK